ncbi:MAG TPA: DUF3488 and transglutaminase-like domain-containing protein [Acidimicrobiales bacterium]|nr:DUF3488 and transglutaminase-like domain-containing protein [Acidimicrobiales bacterium]
MNATQDRPLYPYATAGLVALDLVAGATLGRLFTSADAVWPILLAVLGGHAVALLARYREWSGAVTALAALATGAALVTWLVFPETTAYGFPTSETWLAATNALSDARRSFGVVLAPTIATPGFRLACVFAVATFAAIADWGAFRVGVTVEAAVPAFTLFVFSSVLSTAEFRAPAALAFAAAIVGWLVLHNAEFGARERPWFADMRAAGSRAILRGGAGLGAVAVLGAAIGLILPFTQDPPAVAWRDRENKPRTTVSPLVDIRSRLVQRGDSVVFTVDSPVRAYWRLTSLDRFDGRIWSSRSSYRDVRSGRNVPDPGPPGSPVMQTFRISSLASIWLPAAYAPISSPTAADIAYDPASSSFITAEATSDGLTYDVTSSIAVPTAEMLGGQSPTAGLRSQLAVPALDARVVRLAAEITGRAATPYAKALALQSFFRNGRFQYDLRVPAGHGGNALTNFLFNTRRGYCEQFAGSYAVLARLAGLPARVAVGFTAGEADPERPNRLVVREINAHAWPEVFLGQAGWVAFEPTPGRGVPGGEGYTGIPESQANVEQPSSATTAAPTTIAPVPEETPTPSTPAAPPEESSPWRTIVLVAIAVAAAIGAYAGAVPAIVAVRRRSRWAAARTPEDRALLAWQEAGSALSAAGHRSPRGATPAQVAQSAAPLVGEEAERLGRLATTSVIAVYAPPRLRAEDVDTAQADADRIATAALSHLNRPQRLRRALNPRRLT